MGQPQALLLIFLCKAFYNNDLQTAFNRDISASITSCVYFPDLPQLTGGSPYERPRLPKHVSWSNVQIFFAKLLQLWRPVAVAAAAAVGVALGQMFVPVSENKSQLPETRISDLWRLIVWKLKSLLAERNAPGLNFRVEGGRHSTEVAFVLLTMQHWVWFLAFPKIYSMSPSIINKVA